MQTVSMAPVQRAMAPERSREQRMEALKSANRVRVYRAGLKREVAAGRRSAVDVLARPEELVETMKVVELLLAVPKVGRVKAHSMLRRHQVSPSKTVGGLSSRQRAALVAELGRRLPTGYGVMLAA